MKRTFAALVPTYYELVQSLVSGCIGVCLLDSELASQGFGGRFDPENFASWLRTRGWKEGKAVGSHAARLRGSAVLEVALPLVDSAGKMIAALCIATENSPAGAVADNPGKALRQRLKPALDCLHRELGAAMRARTKTSDLTDRTQDLQWLFEIAGDLGSAAGSHSVLEGLVTVATVRMGSAFGALIVPEQSLLVEHAVPGNGGPGHFAKAREQTQTHLLAWAQRSRRPLVINRVGRQAATVTPCKVLCVPVLQNKKRVIGILVFINPPDGADYQNRQTFLAAHIARQAAVLLQAQFDLATGLYTRSALEQVYEALPAATRAGKQTVLHIDIDQLHVINELHGFNTGDDLIVRLAHLLVPPILPADALAARLSGDRFIVILPSCDTRAAAELAVQLQQAIARQPVGDTDGRIEATLSCGITDLSALPGGLARALAAAETACQAAKDRGRSRVEIYACDDASIIQRHGDVFIVGSLREALKTNQFVLYAQPIRPLKNPELPGGYEILIRLRNADSSIATPSEFFSAAQRYQLLPAIDQWVLDHALETLEKHASLLRQRRISFSLNVTGSSLADDKFANQLIERLRTSRIPPGFISVEITEQAAMRNLPCAVRVMNKLRGAGCGVALDDFGTGTNSLTYLRDLPITRVKIDGSFVRDILTNGRSEATIRAIMQLVRAFPVDTVAEYVETAAVAQRLKAIGVDYGQGYAFGKPEPLDTVLEGLERDESRTMHALSLEI
jgi:diguanylate cyclase (GGDEF)-like protein